MFYLEPVAISRRVDLWHTKAALNQASITEAKLVFLEAQSCCEVQSILMGFSAFERLSFDSQIEREQAQMFSDSECRTKTDSFINRMTDIATQTKTTLEVEIDLLGDRNGEYDVVPLLRVCLIECACLSENS